MANKRAKPEEIVTTLRQVEGLVGHGMPRAEAIRQIGGEPCCAIGPSDNGERANLLSLAQATRLCPPLVRVTMARAGWEPNSSKSSNAYKERTSVSGARFLT